MRIMKKVLLIPLFFLLISTISSAENNVAIKYKVENQIITNVDIIKEQKYLIALNNKLNSISKKELKKLAEKSLLSEKIKINTLNNFYDLTESFELSETLFVNMYSRLGFESENAFNEYLKNFELNTTYIKDKVKIEALWNKLIYNKFKKQVKVDENKIKKELNILNSSNTNLKEYLLSEILFKVNIDENLDQKYNLILSDIKKNGFETTANIYSISPSSKYGGNVGWVKKVQVVDVISKTFENLEIGKISEPIKIGNGYLLIKINEVRKIKKEINFEKDFEKMISLERDRQLNEFSLIFFNKVKQKLLISEL